MGAKTWMLVYANGSVVDALRSSPSWIVIQPFNSRGACFPRTNLSQSEMALSGTRARQGMKFTLAAFQAFRF